MFGRSSGINSKYDDPSSHDGKYPPDWDARRQAVYERDNYTCQDCGLRSGPHAGDGGATLHAHHLISLRDGGGHHLANLVTVCQYCHDGIHGHLTGSQYDEGEHNALRVLRVVGRVALRILRRVIR
ncbi:HNH endonuclease (plasmid) [Haloplanus rallus]|uniref:HNH endonuclease n=2 Tax=Halobacteriales TaxID=2235 RepID=A0A6B9F017_9EURY|nr:HNH endonuclease [Haloplanus rallus]RNJ22526.1 HNH endonuclease [Salella cibi]